MKETLKDLAVLIFLLGVLCMGIPYAIVGVAALMGIGMGYWNAAIILLVVIVISKVTTTLADDLI